MIKNEGDDKVKQYWPMAITEDGEKLFTYESALTFGKAEKQFDIWQNHYKYKLAARWIDIVNEDGTKERSMMRGEVL